MKGLLTLFALFVAVQCFAVQNSVPTHLFATEQGMEVIDGLPTPATNLLIQDFLDLTPKKYREMTGEKLGFKNTVKLKAAQKLLKKKMKKADSTDIPKGLYIVLVILGWGWLAMGLMDDFAGNNWWVNLILVLLCWLPGVIHGLVKMKEYY